MAVIQNIKNKLGTIVYPKTLTKAVYEEDGTRLDNEISAITSDISSLNDTITNMCQYGTWTPTAEHFTITNSNCQYYKIGKLVTVYCAIWGSGDSTDNVVSFSLPFVVKSIRCYGNVGYFLKSANYPNLHTVSLEGQQKLYFEYGTTNNIANITGKQTSNCQFTLTYLTE